MTNVIIFFYYVTVCDIIEMIMPSFQEPIANDAKQKL